MKTFSIVWYNKDTNPVEKDSRTHFVHIEKDNLIGPSSYRHLHMCGKGGYLCQQIPKTMNPPKKA